MLVLGWHVVDAVFARFADERVQLFGFGHVGLAPGVPSSCVYDVLREFLPVEDVDLRYHGSFVSLDAKDLPAVGVIRFES